MWLMYRPSGLLLSRVGVAGSLSLVLLENVFWLLCEHMFVGKLFLFPVCGVFCGSLCEA